MVRKLGAWGGVEFLVYAIGECTTGGKQKLRQQGKKGGGGIIEKESKSWGRSPTIAGEEKKRGLKRKKSERG